MLAAEEVHGLQMGEAGRADPATIHEIPHWDDPTWGYNQGEAIDMACNYLHITDNLLDPSHVSWVHQSSFGSAACEDTALDTIVADNGVTVSRWMRNVEPAPFYVPFLKFKGHCDRKQQYEVRFPSHAYIKAIFVPAGTPTPVVTRLHDEIRKILAQPDMQKRLTGVGMEPADLSVAQISAFQKAEVDKWAQVIKAANIKVD